jgi:hypothetical protein
MSQYSLSFVIEPKDLDVINKAGLRITLAKSITGEDPSNVAWVVIDPFGGNTVEWEEQYGLYASTVEVKKGAKITKLSETGLPATDAAYYKFSESATFKGPLMDGAIGSIPKGTYAALNGMPSDKYPALTFGLTQSALVNQTPQERRPLSASSVPSQYNIKITPLTVVYAWLEAKIVSGTIITEIAGPSTMIKLGGGITSMQLTYNAKQGKFLPVHQGKTVLELPAVQLLEAGIACRADAEVAAVAASLSLG